MGQDTGRALVFSYDYFPGSDFDVVAQLETSTTVRVLQTSDEETVSELSQPDEYTGHVVRYEMGDTAGFTTLLFLQNESLSSGDSGSLADEATVFSSVLNLLETSID